MQRVQHLARKGREGKRGCKINYLAPNALRAPPRCCTPAARPLLQSCSACSTSRGKAAYALPDHPVPVEPLKVGRRTGLPSGEVVGTVDHPPVATVVGEGVPAVCIPGGLPRQYEEILKLLQ